LRTGSVQALADAQADRDLGADLLEGVVALGRAGLLEPGDVVGGEALGEADGGGDVVEGVGVDEDLDIGADSLADGLDHGDAGVLDLAVDLAVEVVAVDQVAGGHEGVGLDGAGAALDLGEGVLDHLLDGAGVLEVGVEGDGVADLAAEQAIDRDAEGLGGDVPAGDVDGAD
jgi:hypothetical protein